MYSAFMFPYQIAYWMDQWLRPTSPVAKMNAQFLEAVADSIVLAGGKKSPQYLFAKMCEATLKQYSFFTEEFGSPEFGYDQTLIDGKRVPIIEEIDESTAFCDLVHFKRQFPKGEERNDPKVILFSPYTGHHATLLREKVGLYLPHHDTYIARWKDAADVPLSAGSFDLTSGYCGDVYKFLTKHKNAHVVSICQATVPTLAVVSYIAETEPGSQPLSMTLVAGPVDTRTASCSVTDFAETTPFPEIKRLMQDFVPFGKRGAGREVIPGHKLLACFMMMNMSRHQDKFRKAWEADTVNQKADSDKIYDFYREYGSVLSMPWEYYEETVKNVFIRPALALGELSLFGRVVNPAHVTCPLFVVEGSKDDISPPGHTLAAHAMTPGISSYGKRHGVYKGGHYGMFAGTTHRTEIAPSEWGFIREAGKLAGIEYSPVDESILIMPKRWDGTVPERRMGTHGWEQPYMDLPGLEAA